MSKKLDMWLIFSMFEHNKKTLIVVAPSAFLKIKTKMKPLP